MNQRARWFKEKWMRVVRGSRVSLILFLFFVGLLLGSCSGLGNMEEKESRPDKEQTSPVDTSSWITEKGRIRNLTIKAFPPYVSEQQEIFLEGTINGTYVRIQVEKDNTRETRLAMKEDEFWGYVPLEEGEGIYHVRFFCCTTNDLLGSFQLTNPFNEPWPRPRRFGMYHLRKVTIAEPLNELVETEGSVRVAGTFGDARWISYVTIILIYGENHEELNYQLNTDGSFNIDIPLVRGAGRYTVYLYAPELREPPPRLPDHATDNRSWEPVFSFQVINK